MGDEGLDRQRRVGHGQIRWRYLGRRGGGEGREAHRPRRRQRNARCVMSTSTRSTDSTFAPSARIPLPASRTRSLPSFPATSTADVSPPYLAVSNPALAIDPLVPQSRALRPRPPRTWRGPRGTSRPGPRSERSHLDRPPLSVHPLEADGPMGGLPLAQRDDNREVVIGDCRPVELGDIPCSDQLLGGHRAHIVELHPEQPFGGLVVIDQVSRFIHHPHRDGQVAGELPEEDHLHRLLLMRHGGNLPPLALGCHLGTSRYVRPSLSTAAARIEPPGK